MSMRILNQLQRQQQKNFNLICLVPEINFQNVHVRVGCWTVEAKHWLPLKLSLLSESKQTTQNRRKNLRFMKFNIFFLYHFASLAFRLFFFCCFDDNDSRRNSISIIGRGAHLNKVVSVLGSGVGWNLHTSKGVALPLSTHNCAYISNASSRDPTAKQLRAENDGFSCSTKKS